jgi:hypothetical protein
MSSEDAPPSSAVALDEGVPAGGLDRDEAELEAMGYKQTLMRGACPRAHACCRRSRVARPEPPKRQTRDACTTG